MATVYQPGPAAIEKTTAAFDNVSPCGIRLTAIGERLVEGVVKG
jgi:hypothetical protein